MRPVTSPLRVIFTSRGSTRVKDRGAGSVKLRSCRHTSTTRSWSGAGPNGLTAAALLATPGARSLVLEATEHIGGGARTEELTLPGYLHDVCSAIHPLAAGSPAFAPLDLTGHGLELAHPELALAHPLDDGTAGVLDRSFTETVRSLGVDGERWRHAFAPHARNWDDAGRGAVRSARARPAPPVHARVASDSPRSRPRPRTPGALPRTARQGAVHGHGRALRCCRSTHPATASFALVLGAAGHAVGWPAIRGGSQRITDVLAAHRARERWRDRHRHAPSSLADAPERARGVPRHEPVRGVAHRAATGSPHACAARSRGSGAVRPPSSSTTRCRSRCRGRPPTARAPARCTSAVTPKRSSPRKPRSRAAAIPSGRSCSSRSRASSTRRARRPGSHTLWAYCHVPNGSTVDMTDRIEAQLERFAPGFRDVVLARNTFAPADFEAPQPQQGRRRHRRRRR